MRTKLFLLVLSLATVILTSCGTDTKRTVPPGYMGMILTESGYGDKIYSPGMVDIGEVSMSGGGSKLVIIEIAQNMYKEPFNKINADGNDHRLQAKDNIPLAGDIYIKIEGPQNDEEIKHAIQTITAKPDTTQDRTYIITLGDIYERYGGPDVRTNVREKIRTYKDVQEIKDNFAAINGEIGLMVIKTFSDAKAPCKILSARFSNLKEDDVIIQAMNEKIAADTKILTIQRLGAALQQYPAYTQMYMIDFLRNYMENGVKEGQTPNILNLQIGGGSSVAISPKK